MRAHRVFERMLQNPHMEGPGCILTQAGSIIITSTGKQYFAKIGNREDTDRYYGEYESLNTIAIAAPGLAPKATGYHIINSETKELDSDLKKPCLLSEYKDIGPLDSDTAKALAKRLATELHTYKSLGSFGFRVPTYCGRTRQENEWCKSWPEYFDALIGDLEDQLHAYRPEYKALSKQVTSVRERIIPALLGRLVIRPVILHGNLWSGTVGVDRATGAPVIIDPACFFGHNEFDLALSRLLGGMPESFYNTYHEYIRWSEPEEEYVMRQELYQLYHCLNHLLMYGGVYAEGARKKMAWLLKVVPN